MGLSMGFGLSMHQELSLKQRLELRLAHKIEIDHRHTELIFQITAITTGSHYKEAAQCTECHINLTKLEILQGFTRDREDVRTTCPKCGHRFYAHLVAHSDSGSLEITFYCADQTLARLPREDLDRLTPSVFESEFRSEYHSAKIHFGTLRLAYAREGIHYPHNERIAWREKYMVFLGELPDRIIAEHAGVSLASVGTYRRSLGIRSCAEREAKELAELA